MFSYDENELRAYFPLPTVLSGLFEHIETLFNVKIIESKKADIWHKDVWFFDVFDLNGSSAAPIANFYLDPYARGTDKFRKEPHSGWVSTIKSKSKIGDSTPLIALIFNFPSPVGDKPSLLSFKDVQVLFQKVISYYIVYKIITDLYIYNMLINLIFYDCLHITVWTRFATFVNYSGVFWYCRIIVCRMGRGIHLRFLHGELV